MPRKPRTNVCQLRSPREMFEFKPWVFKPWRCGKRLCKQADVKKCPAPWWSLAWLNPVLQWRYRCSSNWPFNMAKPKLNKNIYSCFFQWRRLKRGASFHHRKRKLWPSLPLSRSFSPVTWGVQWQRWLCPFPHAQGQSFDMFMHALDIQCHQSVGQVTDWNENEWQNDK